MGASESVTKLNKLLAQATNDIGGTFVQSPFFAAFGQQEITVHAMYVVKINFKKPLANNRIVVELELATMGLVLMAQPTTSAKSLMETERVFMMAL